MTKTIGVVVIIIGASWCLLAAGCTQPATGPAKQPLTRPAKELEPDLGNKVTMKQVLIDVRAHGAQVDGNTLDSAAVQAAIDAASAAGGGVVVVPPGQYLVAGVRLKSNVSLRLDKKAVLLGSTRKEDYGGQSPAVVLGACDANHIAIEGEGAIDGQARGNYGDHWGEPNCPAFRTHLVQMDRCQDVSIRGVSLLYSDEWTLHLRRCQKVRIDHVEIRGNYKRLNCDGIDPDACRDVNITNCHIVSGDDAIVLKTTVPYPCEDIEVSDCVLESATVALKLGTESQGNFRNIRFRNCKIVNSPVGVGFYVKDGATVQNVLCQGIQMDLCQPVHHAVVPLFIDIEKRTAASKVGSIRDVTFQDSRSRPGRASCCKVCPRAPWRTSRCGTSASR